MRFGLELRVREQFRESSHSCVRFALCNRSFEPTLDELVEVVFAVSPRVRKIAAHEPHRFEAHP
jgi:Family of unknown function (DUF5939)